METTVPSFRASLWALAAGCAKDAVNVRVRDSEMPPHKVCRLTSNYGYLYPVYTSNHEILCQGPRKRAL